MIKDYSQLEQIRFRTFLAFSLLILVFLIPSLFIFSQSYRVKDIEVKGSLSINEYHFSQFYDTSIWAIGENSFESIYTLDKTIEKNVIKINFLNIKFPLLVLRISLKRLES